MEDYINRAKSLFRSSYVFDWVFGESICLKVL